MKIQQHSKPSVDPLKLDLSKGNKQVAFQSVIQEASKELKGAELQRLLHQIDHQGELLGKERTFQNLSAYKRMVKQFLEEAVSQGLMLSEKKSMDHYGRSRTYKLVETVENKLIEIQEEMREKEKNGMTLLSLVGEIKGLLVDLSL
ncbi:YaaR family protein [Pseudalkalibacillus hwajinpoensis]|uniref:YaaR family protein n=1 Tax=Guptibacillus hwajinpoensis TaxID=208199 RepID=UPI001CD5F9B5|nr:YaaR family protein [Pseudalkalibacillus hwajinpoensis]MCA0991159.1 YaaR family protein [Pseudalkalibacillus hwajinpoensis]